MQEVYTYFSYFLYFFRTLFAYVSVCLLLHMGNEPHIQSPNQCAPNQHLNVHYSQICVQKETNNTPNLQTQNLQKALKQLAVPVLSLIHPFIQFKFVVHESLTDPIVEVVNGNGSGRLIEW